MMESNLFDLSIKNCPFCEEPMRIDVFNGAKYRFCVHCNLYEHLELPKALKSPRQPKLVQRGERSFFKCLVKRNHSMGKIIALPNIGINFKSGDGDGDGNNHRV